MRVGVLLPVIARRPAGVGRYADEVCRRLAREGPELVALSQSVELHPRWVAEEGVVRIPGGRTPGPVRRAARLAWGATPVSEVAITRAGIDVLLGIAQELPLRRTRIPSVLVVHDLISLHFPARRRLDAVAVRRLMPRQLMLADAVVTVSRATRDDLVTTFGVDAERVHVIPSGVDHDHFRPASVEAVRQAHRDFGLADDVILHLGTLAPHKDAELLVRALAVGTLRSNGIRVAFIGPIPRRDRRVMMELASSLGVADRVLWPGFVSDEALPALLTGAPLVCQLSHIEGFGLAVLEAMACGAPVVVSAAAALRETVGSGGAILESREADALAELIDHQLSEPRTPLRERALTRAAEFDWSTAVLGIRDLLTRIVAVV